MAGLLAPGTTLHGRYTIEQVLHVGPRTAVYLGRDAQGATNLVAVRESLDPSSEAQASFQQEAQTLAALEHPALQVVIDYFAEPSGQQYLVLEHVAGQNLEEALVQRGPLPLPEVLTWFDRLLAAVEYLHAQHPPIIHGNISPESIVIAPDGAPRLVDLVSGGEGAVQSETDSSGAPAPSPFIAPEQYRGSVEERSDVYALGATLYALLTGRKPPTALARESGAALPPPRQFNRTITPMAENAILKAMALESQQRFDKPAEIWQAMQKPPAAKRSRPLGPALVVAAGVLFLAVAVIALVHLLPPLISFVLSSRVPAQPATSMPTAIPVAAITVRPTPAAQPTAEPTLAPPPTELPAPPPTLAPPPTELPAPPPTVVPTTAPSPRLTALTPSPAPAQPEPPRWFRAPAPLSPGDGDSLEGEVEFRWYWNETLAPDEYFDLQVWRVGTWPAGIAWCKDPFYRTSSLPGGAGNFFWRVRVIRGVDGQVMEVLSDPSSERALEWRLGDR